MIDLFYMKEHPTKIVEKIHAILNVLDECNFFRQRYPLVPRSTRTKGNSLANYDALHAIRHLLERPRNDWAVLSDKTFFKRKLKKISVVI